MPTKVDEEAAPAADAPSSGTEPRFPGPLMGALHLAALWALAFAQPLFELLGRNSVFFVARGNEASEIFAFALIITIGPFLVFWALGTIVELVSPRARHGLHLLLLTVLMACFVLQLLGQVMQSPAGLMVAVAASMGGLTAWIYAKRAVLRQVFDILSPAPLVILTLFLVIGPTSKLVLPGSEPGPMEVEIAHPAPVVMIVLDELPAGSMMTPDGDIDSTRFPTFARLAEGSTWYRDAMTVSAFTSSAVPAILTGRLPEPGQLPIAAEQPESIFTLLGSDYRLSVLEDATKLCPEGLCPEDEAERSIQAGLGPLFSDLSIVSRHLLLPEAMRSGLPDVSETFGGFAADIDGASVTGDAAGGDAHVVAMALARENRTSEEARVETFLEGFEDGGGDGTEPSFHFLHMQKPHYPWRNLPDGRLYSPDMGEWIRLMDEDSVWQTEGYVTDIALQRHLLEAGHADKLLGRIADELQDRGIWDPALVVVTADHGGGMIPGEPRRNPTVANLGQVAPVPLFVKLPDQTDGEVVDGVVCTSDIVPLIASELGVSGAWAGDECDREAVTVADLPDGSASAPAADVLAARDEYVTRIVDLFGSGNGWVGVYRPQEHIDLIGQRVGTSSLPVLEGRSAASARPENPRALDQHRPRAAIVPALLQRGELEGVDPGTTIVLALDGEVVAAGPAHEVEGRIVYSILLPPDSVDAGGGQLEVYALDELDDAGFVLRPLAIRGGS